MAKAQVKGMSSCLMVLALAIGVASLQGQEAEEERTLGWFYSAELSFVMAGGNAESSTVGMGAGLRRKWAGGELKFETAGLRTESSTKSRRAVGSPDDFEVLEESTSELTAENYWARLRLDRDISDHIFSYTGIGWNRNTFAGINGRWTFVGGSGVIWADGERSRFRTDVGGTVTVQNDVVEADRGTQTFAGLRISWDYLQKLTATTSFTSVLVLDESLADTEDFRADFVNSLLVSISGNLAFRTSFQLLYDNLPSLTTVELESPAGVPTGDSVLTELENVDTLFTVTLVVNF